ncbi:MAG TPA: DUF6687 family protein [Candidatus Polarisedimenticolia bacterium]|nr:DUF6687 family protein [Candidatus Polarisedimenticolia bacterium]
MLFAFYEDALRGRPFLCVDGVVEEGLNLSHWPGNRTPVHLKADTTTEMALNLARDPGREAWLQGISVVTNNHFDTDGLLSVWAVLRPEEALRHERALVQAARTGDFGVFTTPEAFKLDAVVTAFDDEARSPIAGELRGLPETRRYQTVYDQLLARLPDLLSGAAAFQSLWADPLRELLRSLMRIRDVARVRERPDARLTVIEAAEPLHPMARLSVAGHHRLLTATRGPGGLLYEMMFRIESWFETVTPVRGGRLDLAPLASELDRLEPDRGGRWVYTGSEALEPVLCRAGPDGAPVPSSLPLETVETALVRLFREHP